MSEYSFFDLSDLKTVASPKSGTKANKPLKYHITNSTVRSSDNLGNTGRFIDQNEIIKRFHLGNEFGSQSSNSVFTPGFEDPTYLMFKVEFGDWGYSLLDLNTISIQQSTSKFSNVYYEDYDAFPMGLLDRNFLDFNGSVNWSTDNKTYNTYNYLMNRNEDARASYIKQFIDGLFVIQKDMPYLFQKISGLEKLQDFDATKGIRLKDAKITLECIEGIDLKIRTLLQLYRKAAYDDVWQRWVLPDIYRYFKMIIYVFDRRILQTGVGTYSLEQNDFPIYALECGPCEIDIESTFENEFSSAYSEQKNSSTKIVISVKNVKTYFANGLLNKIDEQCEYYQEKKNTSLGNVDWISDFDSVTERGSYTSTDMTKLGNFRMRWMKRMFMMPSEYKAYYDNVTHKVGDNSDYNKLYGSNSVYGPTLPTDSTWHYAVVTDNIYNIKSWKGLTKYLKKLLKSRTTLVRDSRFADRSVFMNDLQRPWEYSYIYEPVFMEQGPDVIKAQQMMKERMDQMIQQMLNGLYLIDSSAYYKLTDPGLIDSSVTDITPNVHLSTDSSIADMTFITPNLDVSHIDMEMITPLLDTSSIHQNMITPNLDVNHVDMNMVSPNLDTSHIHQTMLSLNVDSSHIDMDMQSMNVDTSHPSMNMETLNVDTSHVHMNMQSMNVDTSYIDMEMIEPIFNLEHVDMNMHSMNVDASHVHMNMQQLDVSSQHANMDMVVLNMDSSHAEMNMVENKSYTSHTHQTMVEPIFNLEHTDMNMQSVNIDASHNTQTMVKPIMNTSHIDMNMINNIIDNSKSKQSMLSVDVTDDHINMNMIKDLIDNSHTKMNMFTNPQNTDHINMTYIPQDITADHIKSNMFDDPHNEHKSSMNLVSDIQDTTKFNMNMVSDIQDTDISPMNMINNIQDDNKVNMNMISNISNDKHETNNFISIEQTDEPQYHNQMVETVYNEFKAQFNMAPVEISNSLKHMDMATLNVSTSLPKLDMNNLDVSAPLPDMDMYTLDISSSLPNMKMQELKQDVSILDMVMTKPNLNTSLPDMKMTEPINQDVNSSMVMTETIYNEELKDMTMVEPVLNTSLVNMIMVKPNLNTSLADMTMVKPVYNESLQDMTMVEPVLTTDASKMTMVEPVYNESLQDMTMVKPNMSESVKDMSMVEPNLDVSIPKTPMITYDIKDKLQNIDMVKPNLTTYDVKQQMYENKENSHKLDTTQMIDLTDSPDLVKRIQSLTEIDTNELKNTKLEDMISLAEVIDATYDALKEKVRNMKLQDNKPNIPKHVHMKMTSIKQPPRNTMYVKELLNEVSQDAIERAYNAKASYGDNKSNGNKGTAL